jgi:hypothetical protein
MLAVASVEGLLVAVNNRDRIEPPPQLLGLAYRQGRSFMVFGSRWTQIGPKFLSRLTFKTGTRNQHSSDGAEPLHRQEERRLPYSSTLATKKMSCPFAGREDPFPKRPPDRDTGCQLAYFATVFIGNVCPPSSKAVRERRMPSLRILCWSVDRLTPRRAAAPFGPEITPFVSSRARRI